MADMIACIFDTNFIIEHLDLRQVTSKLREKGYSVYVPEIAVQERIAQACLRKKANYEKLDSIRKDVQSFASITITKQYEEVEAAIRMKIQREYSEIFGSNIIPLKVDEDVFQQIINRAYMKVPPFIVGKSDKGFKDSLMWVSILEYFITAEEQEVLFLSNDNGFLEQKGRLAEEFKSKTGKKITIMENKYYDQVVRDQAEQVVCEDAEDTGDTDGNTLDIGELREKIQSSIQALRRVETESYWGVPQLEKTFTTSERFTPRYVSKMFEKMKDKIRSHIFDENIPASQILDLDFRIVDGSEGIPISAAEEALQMYEDMKEKYSEYLPQFYLTVANILNENFDPDFLSDEDAPF